jgi:hypothetical protein
MKNHNINKKLNYNYITFYERMHTFSLRLQLFFADSFVHSTDAASYFIRLFIQTVPYYYSARVVQYTFRVLRYRLGRLL